jgi:phosphatidylserine decarboxylase
MQLANGWQPWVAAPSLAAVLAAFTWWPAAVLLAGLAAFVLVFFRDPDRGVGDGVVAAADGHIQAIDGRAVTFLNLHHVHVVRAPFAGRIDDVERVEGSRWPAFLEGAEKNGGVRIVLDTQWGRRPVDLKAGMIARRAVAFVDEGDTVDKGQRIGMIRFGSRVDVDLPETLARHVESGDRVWAGETTIAGAQHGSEGSP